MLGNARYACIYGHEMRTFSAKISESLSRGSLVFTKQFALENSWAPTERAFIAAAQRAVARGELFHPRRGAFVIVPYQYRADGYVPAEFVLDQLMKVEHVRYYVGLHKAAMAYGVSSRVGAQMTVVSNKRLPTISLGRSSIRFLYSKEIPGAGLIRRKSLNSCDLEVAIPALTLADMLRYWHAAGDTKAVFEVASDLAAQIESDDLATLVDFMAQPVLQRLGFMLDRVGQFERSDELYDLVGAKLRAVDWRSVVDRSDPQAVFDRRWKVYSKRSDIDG